MRTAFLLVAFVGSASAAEMAGYISDEPCGWNNARPGKEAKECALKCVRVGWDPVFVRDGQMGAVKFTNKNVVLPYVGNHVVIIGELKNNLLTVEKIRPSPPPPAKKTEK